MKFNISNKGDVKVFAFFEDEKLSTLTKNLANYIIEKEIFKGKKNEVFLDIGPSSEKVVLLGLGKKEDFNLNTLRSAFFNAGKIFDKHKISDVNIEIRQYSDKFCYGKTSGAIMEGLIQSQYNFDKYLKDKKKIHPTTVNFTVLKEKKERVKEILSETESLCEGVFLTRDLVNTPSCDMYPESLAKEAKDKLTSLGVKVEVFNKEKIEKLGMKAFLAVAQGSDREPKFIVMNYQPLKNQKSVTLVGKGLTYDSGGYAIKSAEGMVTMKTDMAGAASVIGTIYALAKNKVQQNVTGVIASCENMISGHSYVNGDVISSLKGTTIEVLNTDAEGRITLADSIYYGATKTNAEAIVDIATLTGACMVALGMKCSGAFSNNPEILDKMLDASKLSGENLWELPISEEAEELIKGKIGDLLNIGGRYGGSLTAAAFLKHFAEGLPWIHLDIAGPSFTEKPYDYIPLGASGIPVKTLYNFCKNYKENKTCKHE